MHVREAGTRDAGAIAALHAASWRAFYRGDFSDEYLDGDLVAERLRVWRQRLSSAAPNQLVLVMEDHQQIVGFACAFGADDDRWGTLLDNLHVMPERHGQGIGTRLLREVAAWCHARYPDAGLYLWVLERNQPARRFYERLGASDEETVAWTPPGGGETKRHRYAWRSITALLASGERDRT